MHKKAAESTEPLQSPCGILSEIQTKKNMKNVATKKRGCMRGCLLWIHGQ